MLSLSTGIRLCICGSRGTVKKVVKEPGTRESHQVSPTLPVGVKDEVMHTICLGVRAVRVRVVGHKFSALWAAEIQFVGSGCLCQFSAV